MSIKRAIVFLLPLIWFVMAGGVTAAVAQEPVNYSGFAVRVSNGALPPPHNRDQEISAAFGTDNVAIDYERTDGAKSRKWKTVWKGERYRRSRDLVRRTRIQQQPPGRAPIVGGGVFDVTLRAQGGRTRTGKVTNQAEWKKLVDAVDREAQAAWKKTPQPKKRRTPTRASAGPATGAAARAYYDKGRAFEERELWKEAEGAYRQALRLRPDYTDARIRLGWALEGQKRYPEAMAAFRQAIRVEPGSDDAYYGLSYVYGSMGRWQETIAPLQQAIRRAPKRAKLYTSLSYTYIELRRWKEAENAARQAIRIAPNNPDGYYNLASAQLAEGKYADAARSYREVTRLLPKDAAAYNELGNAYFHARQYRDAVAAFEKAVRLDPKMASAYANLGTAYANVGELEKAEETLRQAIRLDPDNADAHNNLGRAYIKQRRLAEAEAAYREAVRAAVKARQRNPRGSEPHFNLAYAYYGLKQWPEAIRAYSAGLRLSPHVNYYWRQRAYAYLFSGTGDLAAASDARAYLRRAGWRDQHAPYMAFVAALGYRRAGREQSALQILDEAVRAIDPKTWPYSVARYLQGALPAESLLALATDNDKKTEAHTYIGMDLLLNGVADAAAREHLRWVAENGNPNFTEYDLAVSELGRLEKPRPPKAPTGEVGA